jgi:replicative DNA helicase
VDFSIGYQLRLLVLLFTEKDFYLDSKDLLKPEFFRLVFGQWLLQFLETYLDTYKGLPTRFTVEEELKRDTSFLALPEEEVLVQQFLELLSTPDKSELNYVKENFIKFAKVRSLEGVLHAESETIQEGNFDDLFTSLRTEAKKFEHSNGTQDEYLFSVRNIEEIFNGKDGIKTGINLIDQIGGLKQKELSFVLGDTNVGKSAYLVNLGGYAVRQQRKVLHVTLEMSFPQILARYLTNLSDPEDEIYYDNIKNFEPQERVFWHVSEKLRGRYEGLLKIVEFPTGKCTIQNLYSLLEKYPGTELLIVDYLQLMQPPKDRDHLRFEMSDLAIALRGIAGEADIHCASALQATRTAANRRLIGKEFSAEAYDPARVADLVIGIGQNTDDAAKREVVLYNTKARYTERNQAERYFINFKTMQFKLMRQELLDHH